MDVRDITTNGKTAQGITIALPNVPLVMVLGARGYIMCGYLNMDTAEKMGDRAAVVRGVASLDELLAGKVVACTSHAQAAGVMIGMSGYEALQKLVA